MAAATLELPPRYPKRCLLCCRLPLLFALVLSRLPPQGQTSARDSASPSPPHTRFVNPRRTLCAQVHHCLIVVSLLSNTTSLFANVFTSALGRSNVRGSTGSNFTSEAPRPDDKHYQIERMAQQECE
jgi:hypothetical protein